MTSRLTRALAVLAGVLTSLCAIPALSAENAGSTDLSTIQANGSPEPVRTGFFTETELGAFLTVGGQNYSNTEAFLGLGVGYDVLQNLSIGVQFQLSPSAQDCYAVDSKGNPTCPAVGPSTFTLASIEAKISYRFPIADRLYIPLRVFGGVTILTPNPQPATAADTGSLIEPTFGGATGIEWATPFDHFNVGAEIMGRFVMQINALALAIYPTVKYTF